jgi:geranylgeranyl diphosphate synthase type II
MKVIFFSFLMSFIVPGIASNHLDEDFPFYSYQQAIDAEIAKNMRAFGGQTALRDACEWALTKTSKRYRGIFTLLIAEGLGNKFDVMPSALAVEFLHVTSVISEELPKVDFHDALSTPLHSLYPESVSLLASYAIFAAAFDQVLLNMEVLHGLGVSRGESDLIGRMAMERATEGSFILGDPGKFMLEEVLSFDVLHKKLHNKNMRLFEASFSLGWLFGGGDPAQLPMVIESARHFGVAFHLADDLGDLQDEKNQRDFSLVERLGKEKSLEWFEEEIALFEETIHKLAIDTQEFADMVTFLKQVAHGV